MNNIFTKHPQEVGETYFEHLKFAALFGFQMIGGGIAVVIHAIFPFVFQKTGSHVLLKLVEGFIMRMQTVDERIIQLAKLIQDKSTTKDNVVSK